MALGWRSVCVNSETWNTIGAPAPLGVWRHSGTGGLRRRRRTRHRLGPPAPARCRNRMTLRTGGRHPIAATRPTGRARTGHVALSQTRGKRRPRRSAAEKHLPQHGFDQDLTHFDAVQTRHHLGTMPLHAAHAAMPSAHTAVTSVHSAHAPATLAHLPHAAAGSVHGGLARGVRIRAMAANAGL
jgi:hypothetical protein